jgi:hypothetical protein
VGIRYLHEIRTKRTRRTKYGGRNGYNGCYRPRQRGLPQLGTNTMQTKRLLHVAKSPAQAMRIHGLHHYDYHYLHHYDNHCCYDNSIIVQVLCEYIEWKMSHSYYQHTSVGNHSQ